MYALQYEDVEGAGVILDKDRTCLPSNLGHTLQHLLPHHTMWELSLFVCIGGT